MRVCVRFLNAINSILSLFYPFPSLTQEQDNVAGVSEAAKPDQPHLPPHHWTREFPSFKTHACLSNRLHLMICLVPPIADVLLDTTYMHRARVQMSDTLLIGIGLM